MGWCDHLVRLRRVVLRRQIFDPHPRLTLNTIWGGSLLWIRINRGGMLAVLVVASNVYLVRFSRVVFRRQIFDPHPTLIPITAFFWGGGLRFEFV